MADEKSTPTSKNDKNDGSRICKPCNISFSNIYSYADHMESKEHVKGVMKKKYGKKYLEAKAKLLAAKKEDHGKENSTRKPKDNLSETALLTEEALEGKNKSEERDNENSDSSENSSSTDAEVYSCQICDLTCTSSINYELHLWGKKHAKKLKNKGSSNQSPKSNLILEFDSKSESVSPEDAILPGLFTSSPWRCEICVKTFNSPESFKQHNESDTHRKEIAMKSVIKDLEDRGLCKSTDKDEFGARKYHCDTCGKEFSGPLPFSQHMTSMGHSKMVRHKAQLSEIKDLAIFSKEDSKLKCKECEKFFSGPKPFLEHLTSCSKKNIKSKSNILADLQKKFPNLVILPKVDSDGNDYDDGKQPVLGCNICCIPFSGPESARDHFTSPKHQKTANGREKNEMHKKKKKGEKKNLLVLENNDKTKDQENDTDDSSSGESFTVIP